MVILRNGSLHRYPDITSIVCLSNFGHPAEWIPPPVSGYYKYCLLEQFWSSCGMAPSAGIWILQVFFAWAIMVMRGKCKLIGWDGQFGYFIPHSFLSRRIRIFTEEKAKVVVADMGDVLECRTSHLAARMILRKVFGRTSMLGGWWFDAV